MIREFKKRLDENWLKTNILNMYHLERKQTFPKWCESAEYAYNLLKSEGLDAELIHTPADGLTTWQDKRAPIGWDCHHATLTLLSSVSGISDPVIADYDREPLHIVKHSVSTPEGGINARVVTENQMKAGEDVHGAFVLLNNTTRPREEAMCMIMDLGGIGWISDYVENPMKDPDGVAWINAGCENNEWHVQADGRDFISYQISPRVGFYLRQACQSRSVMVHAESDGHRYAADLPIVTGLLPGEDPREIWMVGHLYEPLIDDNTNGVIGAIKLLKILKDLSEEGKIHLKYSVRVIFASEMYGFAAFCELFGNTRSKVLGGINMDGILGSTDKSVGRDCRLMEAVDYKYTNDRAGGFWGNVFLSETSWEASAEYPDWTFTIPDHILGDDCSFGDSTNGIPVVWIKYGGHGYHHNSVQSEKILDIDSCVMNLSLCGDWVRRMAASTENEIRALLPRAVKNAQNTLNAAVSVPVRPGTDVNARMKFLYERECGKIRSLSIYGDIPELEDAVRAVTIPTPLPAPAAEPAPERPAYAQKNARSWYDYADDFIFTRISRGFPHDLVKLPKERRRQMPGTILYADLADVFSRMTPGVTLQTLLREVEWDKGIIFTEKTIRDYIFTCTMLAEAGYIGMEQRNLESVETLTAALKALGVKDGDTLLVHSSLSGLGYLPGGADALIEAVGNAVGKTGTFLAPAFSRPYIGFEGTLNKNYNYRPYDTRPDGALRDKSIWTGAVPKAMLARPDSARSGHSTHEWVAMGAEAKECVAGHGFLDAPTGLTSPLTAALHRHGSVVFLGCSISSNTFLHYVEDLADAPFLEPGIIKYIAANGTEHTALIERHLPGHRDFYGDPAKSEFYAKAIERGLHIYAVPFGMTTLYRMDLDELYSIGMDMFREDPCATLCNSKDCYFCQKYRK